jgi:hypothetical protein
MGYENSGRRPQPRSLKVLRGNPSKTRLSELEPVPPAGEVVKPAGLAAGVEAVWDELAPICLAMRTLTLGDVRVFVTMCELQASFNENAAQRGTDGFNGRRELDIATTLRPYYALFGLEPVSRARIQIPKTPEAPTSKWAGVLK